MIYIYIYMYSVNDEYEHDTYYHNHMKDCLIPTHKDCGIMKTIICWFGIWRYIDCLSPDVFYVHIIISSLDPVVTWIFLSISFKKTAINIHMHCQVEDILLIMEARHFWEDLLSEPHPYCACTFRNSSVDWSYMNWTKSWRNDRCYILMCIIGIYTYWSGSNSVFIHSQ